MLQNNNKNRGSKSTTGWASGGGKSSLGADDGDSSQDSVAWLRLDDLHEGPGGRGYVEKLDSVHEANRLFRCVAGGVVVVVGGGRDGSGGLFLSPSLSFWSCYAKSKLQLSCYSLERLLQYSPVPDAGTRLVLTTCPCLSIVGCMRVWLMSSTTPSLSRTTVRVEAKKQHAPWESQGSSLFFYPCDGVAVTSDSLCPLPPDGSRLFPSLAFVSGGAHASRARTSSVVLT